MFGLQHQSITALVMGLSITTSLSIPWLNQSPVLAQAATYGSSNWQATFYDIQGHWAASCINQLASQEIINGYPDGSFRPQVSINRAEFTAIVGNAFPRAVQKRQAIKFVDVPNYYWAYEQILAATQTGFLSGYPGRVFRPQQKISRAQVLVALANGLNYAPTQKATTTLFTNFTDAKTIPAYAQNSIAAATEKRMVVNYPNVKLLNPNRRATRAEVAAFLCQAMTNYGSAAVVPEQYIANPAKSPTASNDFGLTAHY